jgi:hypothetical protein
VTDAARATADHLGADRIDAASAGLVARGADDMLVGIDELVTGWDALLAYVVGEVTRHLDIDRLVDSMDVNALADRIDVNGLLGRVDINGVLERVDVNGLLERVDVNALIDRVDLDRIVRRVDVGNAARRVTDELDVGELVRESSGSLSTETVDAVRRRAADADAHVEQVIDSALRRRRDRMLRVGGGPREPRSDRT